MNAISSMSPVPSVYVEKSNTEQINIDQSDNVQSNIDHSINAEAKQPVLSVYVEKSNTEQINIDQSDNVQSNIDHSINAEAKQPVLPIYADNGKSNDQLFEPEAEQLNSLSFDLYGRLIDTITKEPVSSIVNKQVNVTASKRKSKRVVICPVESCKKPQTHFTRHLKNVHKWNKSAKHALNVFKLRKTYIRKKKKTPTKVMLKKIYKNYHKQRMCPKDGCIHVSYDIGRHLQRDHHMLKNPEYYDILARSKIYTGAEIPKMVLSSPSKFFNKKSTRQQLNFPAIKPLTTSPPSELMTQTPQPIYELMTQPPSPISELIPQPVSPAVSIETVTPPSFPLFACDASDEEFPSDDEESESTNPGVIDALSMSIFDKFYSYLTSVAGRKRNIKSSASVVREVKRIYTAIEAYMTKDLFLKEKLLLFFDNYCTNKKYKGRTKKKYCCSLLDFYSFIIVEEIDIPDLTTQSKYKLMETVRVWSKSFNREIRIQHYELQDLAQTIFITPEQIATYTTSQSAKDAENILLELEKNSLISIKKSDHSNIRDHIFVIVHTTSAHRSGISSNMTVAEVKCAKFKDGHYVIKIKVHKTADTYGPAYLPLTAHNFKLLNIFIEKVRPITEPQSTNVFLSNNGRIMESGSISNRINTIWHRLGLIEKGKRLCINVIRKTVQSEAREQNTGHLDQLASLLSHSRKTAEDSYVVRKREKDAMVGVATIGHFQHHQ